MGCRPHEPLTTVLIVIAMLVTAGSLVIVLSVRFGLGVGEAVSIGAALLTAFGLMHLHMERRRDRAWVEQRMTEVSAAASDGNTEVGQVAARVNRLEREIAPRVRRETEPLAAEVEVLGHLMKQIAETVADLEIRTDRRIEEVAKAAAKPRLVAPEPAAVPPPVRPAERFTAEAPPVSIDPPRLEPPQETPRVASAFEREVEAAVRAERIELHLQPIVTLPQRKVRYYEVLTRLRGGDNRLITAAEFLPAAENRRLIAKIDTYQVIRSFQVLKRLTARNSEIGLFVNLSCRASWTAPSSGSSWPSSVRTARSPISCSSSSRKPPCATWGRSKPRACAPSPTSASASPSTTSPISGWTTEGSPISASAPSRSRRTGCSAAPRCRRATFTRPIFPAISSARALR